MEIEKEFICLFCGVELTYAEMETHDHVEERLRLKSILRS